MTFSERDFMALDWFSAALLRNLRVGAVIYRWCGFCEPPKFKYLVVVSTEPRLLVLVVNSEINQFYIDRGLDKFHVLVPVVEHDFLKHDSYTCCIEAFATFDLSDLREEILKKYEDVLKGHLTAKCLVDVYRAVVEQNMIQRGLKNEILNSISSELCAVISKA